MSWSRALRRLFNVLVPKARPGTSSSKLTRADVLRMIEENGEPVGLDLSGRDLSWIDLGRDVISREAEAVWQMQGERPVWQNERNGGINLRGVILKDADLFGANLAYADLKDAILEGAMMKASCLAKSWLRRANLRYVDLSRADLSGARANDADLRDTDLGSADLSGTDFDGAKLQGASVYKAILSGTRLSRRELGNAIIQENLDDLIVLISRHNPHLSAEAIEKALREREFEEARQVYAGLKANFLETGNFDDASWAHIKERRMGRKTKAPWRARKYHGQTHPLGAQGLPSYESLPRWHPLTWWFWFKYLWKWLLDWAAELSCGYGERPWQTVVLAAVILAVFPFIFWAIGGVGQYDPAVGLDIPSLDFLDYVIYSAGAFATIGYEGLKPINTAAQVWTAAEAVLGISILALLMFTLGNRISRS